MNTRTKAPEQVALLLWLAGLLLSATAVWMVNASNQRLYSARLLGLTNDVEEFVRQRFGLYEYGLRGTRGAVVAAGGDAVNRAAFEAYIGTRDIAREFPGARGLGFVRRVPRADEAQFVARARAEGPADFAIRELAPHADDRFIIQYIYPVEANRGATGLDVASEVKRREAALAAARAAQVQLTAPITLVQAGAQPRRGFLAFLPVYQRGAELLSVPAREASTLGWVYAPLLVDEVLAGLGPRMQEVRIQLSDAGEPDPFFDSASESDAAALAGVPELRREIRIFGRSWSLRTQALAPLSSAARPISTLWVGGLGALMSTSLAVMCWLHFARRRERLAGWAYSAAGGTPVTLRGFLGSPQARVALLVYLVFIAIYLVVVHQQQWAHQIAETRRTLAGIVDERAAQLKTAQATRRRTMVFLADTPPVQGLVRATATGVDPRDGSSRLSWELRMQEILGAHLRASPEVYQARLIGVANGGRELVRVDRRGADVAVTPETELQTKGDRPYMRQTLALQSGEVWASAVELNQEHGKVEVPHRPTVRYSTPVYAADGKAFGILIVNVDVSKRLADAAAAAPTGGALHVTNADGDFLTHPDTTRRFGFDLGRRHRWEDEFKPAPWIHGPSQERLRAWQGAAGRIIAATATVVPNGGSPIGTVRYMASLPEAHLQAAVWRGLAQSVPLPLFAGAVGLLMLYLYWASVQRQLQVTGQRLRLAAIVDQSADAIIGLDGAQRIMSWNRGAAELFGYREEEAIGRPLAQLIGAEADGADLLKGDAVGQQVREFDARSREGAVLRVAMSLSRLQLGSQGEVSAILRDVTEERAAQQRIAELNIDLERQVQERTASLALEQERLANILRGTDAGTWEWNAQTGEAVFNERWAEMIGYRIDELTPIDIDTWRAHVHPEDLQKSDEMLRRHLAGEAEQYAIEVRMRHKDGRWVWILSKGRLSTRTPDGQAEWVHGTHQDITAIKEAELEVKRAAALLGSVLNAATEVSIIATDPQGLITIFNAGAEALLGYRADEIVGISSPAPLHLAAEVSARGAELSAEYGEAVEGFRVFVHKAELEGAEQREWTYVRKDGSHVPVSLVVTAIRNEDRSIAGYLGIAQNIAERLRAESALRHAKAAAETANAAKSLFLANMSHEIRTPMNAVIGVAHLLETTPLDHDQRQLLAKLQIAGRSLLGIINDVLDLSKIESGEMSIELAPMDPVALLSELQQLFGPQAQAKGLTLEMHGSEGLPASLITDELRLRQILSNLISNAIKFTAQGRVTLQALAESDSQGRRWVRWTVRDTGIGIPAEALSKLFDPFVQADASTTRRFGGTGLGLSIVRKLAELMGGEAGVRSEPGSGSDFWVRLPCGDEVAAEHALRPATAPGLHVVVVDDRADERRGLAGLCRSLGWAPLELESGAALIAYYRRVLAEGLTEPNALLVDWQMPGLDGLHALEQLADEIRPKRLPSMLIISAHERSAIAALDHRHLIDHILTKPVGPSELFNAVNHSVAQRLGSTERVARSTRIEALDARWLVGVELLVVDDSDVNLEVAQRLLEHQGGIVETAVNGCEALARLRESPQRFDAVLMDIQMPEMDGYEATRLIRSELGLTKLPVLALTAGALGEERRRAEAADMTDFLTKPLDPRTLVRAVRRAVEKARGHPLPLPPVAPSARPPMLSGRP